MKKNKNITTGQMIRRIRAGEIAPVYILLGGDPFLEDFFIQELSKMFCEKTPSKIYFSMDQDPVVNLFEELSSISLFKEKKVIIVREIKKLRSKSGREELIDYVKYPNSDTSLVLISEEYDMKNNFIKQISNSSEVMDFRPPFENEMKKWVSYIINSKGIQIADSSLNEYIQLFGDSIAHVINEIEKMHLFLGSKHEINDKNITKIKGNDRVYHLWNLQDSLGKKDLELTVIIIDSLIKNGTKITGILISITNLYQQLLWKKMGRTSPIGYTGINKIITSRLSYYDNNYSYGELKELLQQLRKVDLLSKSANLNDVALLCPFINKACNKKQYV